MLKKVASVSEFFGDVVVPMLRKKLGGGWKTFVRYYEDAKTGQLVLRFKLSDNALFSDITGALFNLARGCGVELGAVNREKKFTMALQPA